MPEDLGAGPWRLEHETGRSPPCTPRFAPDPLSRRPSRTLRLPAAGDVVVHGDRESDECHAVVCSTDGHRLVKMEGAAQQAAIWRHLVAGGVLSRPGRPWPTAKGPTSWVDQQPMRPSPTSV
jgi:hypothetical protein